MENTQRTFANGIFFNEPHEKVKEFMIGSVVFSKNNFLTWLDKCVPDEKGYVKLDIKRPKDSSKSVYFELNTYVPNRVTTQPRPQNTTAREDESDEVRLEDIPF